MNISGKQYMKFLFRMSVNDSFGKFTDSTIEHIDYEHFPEKLAYRYKIPPALCHEIHSKDNKKELYFSTSGVLAVMDELSTVAFSLEDRSYRNGVSLDLSVETLKPIPAKEDVMLVTRTDKGGKVCTMELTNLQGEVLARGKHTPVTLPSPFTFLTEIFFRSSLFGTYLYFYEEMCERQFSTSLDQLLGIPDHPVLPISEDILIPEFVFNTLLDLSVSGNPIDRMRLLDLAPDNHDFERCELFELKVKKEIKNSLGSMHGGAVGMAIEESSRRFKEVDHPELEHLLKLKSMDIRYLAPMTVSLFVWLDVINFLIIFLLSIGRTHD
jgi:acyl-coenzyme A thioesterase PaaI-like protein